MTLRGIPGGLTSLWGAVRYVPLIEEGVHLERFDCSTGPSCHGDPWKVNGGLSGITFCLALRSGLTLKPVDKMFMTSADAGPLRGYPVCRNDLINLLLASSRGFLGCTPFVLFMCLLLLGL